MINVKFQFEGDTVDIQSNENEIMKNIFNIYFMREGIDKNRTYFLYNGNKVNPDLKLSEVINDTDKECKAMVFLVFEMIEEFVKINVQFIYDGNSIEIQSNENEIMENIFKRYFMKVGSDKNRTYFLYNGNKVNPDLKLSQVINISDKEFKRMVLIVGEISEEFAIPDKTIKNIICPKCKELCFININNYKISLNKCKNQHNIENILLNDFESQQTIDLKNIKCHNCGIDKSNINNSIFYICFNCKKNLCPQCKSNHDRGHNIINYEEKDFKCSTHYESFNSYCKNCNKNLCPLCKEDNEHADHEIILFNDLEPNENSLKENLKELKKKIESLKKEANKITYTLEYIINNMEKYYKINQQIINNYEANRRNYQILYNIKELNNSSVIKDIDEIVSNESISVKIINFLDIFKKMNINKYDEISIIYDVGKNEGEEEMKIFGEMFVHSNKNICKMIIEDKVYELKEKFNIKNYKKKELKITLKNIGECSEFVKMFDECKSLDSLPEFYKLNTIDINLMIQLLKKCYESFFKNNAPKWYVSNLIHLLLQKKQSLIEYKKIEKVYSQLEDEYFISTIMDVEKVIEKIIELNCNVEEINNWVIENMGN